MLNNWRMGDHLNSKADRKASSRRGDDYRHLPNALYAIFYNFIGLGVLAV
jgi:hypothetical protein